VGQRTPIALQVKKSLHTDTNRPAKSRPNTMDCSRNCAFVNSVTGTVTANKPQPDVVFSNF